MRYLICDTETTGVGADDKVCEVAWCEITRDFEVVDQGSSLINPGIPIGCAAQAVNGISNDMVKDAPTLDEYMESVGHPLLTADVFIAHNAPFDWCFLKEYASDECVMLDTLRVARLLYPDAENHKQATLAVMLGIHVDRAKAHSADGDIFVLAQLLRRMCEDANTDIDGLIEMQKRPIPITKMTFGKHKGKALKDLPSDYVWWLKTKADNVSPDLRAALNAL